VLRLVIGAAVLLAFVSVLWVFTGLPSPVATAMDDALYAPCPSRYASARSVADTTLMDGYVLRPRTRFERAITCGSERAKRERR